MLVFIQKFRNELNLILHKQTETIKHNRYNTKLICHQEVKYDIEKMIKNVQIG